MQNCADSEIGKLVIQVAKERKHKTISIIDDKPGTPDIIEELKALGGDIVVPESYTKTWYFLLSWVTIIAVVSYDKLFWEVLSSMNLKISRLFDIKQLNIVISFFPSISV